MSNAQKFINHFDRSRSLQGQLAEAGARLVEIGDKAYTWEFLDGSSVRILTPAGQTLSRSPQVAVEHTETGP